MRLRKHLKFISILIPIIITGCRPNSESSTPIVTGPEDRRVTITDRTGREWDITHAVEEYGMEKDKFHFALGVGAIPSVDNPKVYSRGDASYPQDDETFRIFGLDIEGEQRGYSRTELKIHEVFNEKIPGVEHNDVIVCYCHIWNYAAVINRRLDYRALQFTASGWTYGDLPSRSLFVLADKETLSLWFPMTIRGIPGLYCISGKLKDSFLREIQLLARNDWDEWRNKNPETKYVTDEP